MSTAERMVDFCAAHDLRLEPWQEELLKAMLDDRPGVRERLVRRSPTHGPSRGSDAVLCLFDELAGTDVRAPAGPEGDPGSTTGSAPRPG
jgi:hypothetical protein